MAGLAPGSKVTVLVYVPSRLLIRSPTLAPGATRPKPPAVFGSSRSTLPNRFRGMMVTSTSPGAVWRMSSRVRLRLGAYQYERLQLGFPMEADPVDRDTGGGHVEGVVLGNGCVGEGGLVGSGGVRIAHRQGDLSLPAVEDQPGQLRGELLDQQRGAVLAGQQLLGPVQGIGRHLHGGQPVGQGLRGGGGGQRHRGAGDRQAVGGQPRRNGDRVTGEIRGLVLADLEPQGGVDDHVVDVVLHVQRGLVAAGRAPGSATPITMSPPELVIRNFQVP